MPLRALIFDVDGTLAETEEAHRTAFNRAFNEAGPDWVWSVDAYRDLLRVTGGQQRIRHFLDTTGRDATADAIVALHEAKNRLYADMVERGQVALRPGIARLIGEARDAGVRLAIATTTSRSNIEALLAALLPTHAAQFDVIVAGEDVAIKKPHPEVYERTLAGLGLSATEVIAFEDSRNGLLAAIACGIPTVVTPSFYTGHEDFRGAVLIQTDLDHPVPVDLGMLSTLAGGSRTSTKGLS